MTSENINMYNDNTELEIVFVTLSDNKNDKKIEKDFYSISDVMKITGFSRSTVMRALKQEKLLSRKIKGRRVIEKSDFEEYMKGDE